MSSSAAGAKKAFQQKGRRYLSVLVRFRRVQLIVAVLLGALLGGGAVAAAGGLGGSEHGGHPSYSVGYSVDHDAGRHGDSGPSGYDG